MKLNKKFVLGNETLSVVTSDSLTLMNVTRDQDGLYTCKSSDNKQEKQFKLIVERKILKW